MTRVRRLLWALPLLPLAAQPAQAMSITCYGSIVITSLGTDGVKIESTGPVTVTPGLGDPPPTIGNTGGTGGELPPPSSPPTMSTTNTPSTPSAAGTPSAPGTGAQGNPTPTSGPTTPATDTPPPPPGAGPDNPPLPVEPPPTTEPPVPGEPVPPTSEPPPSAGGGGVANTPEPASLTLLALAGLGGLGYARRRRG